MLDDEHLKILSWLLRPLNPWFLFFFKKKGFKQHQNLLPPPLPPSTFVSVDDGSTSTSASAVGHPFAKSACDDISTPCTSYVRPLKATSSPFDCILKESLLVQHGEVGHQGGYVALFSAIMHWTR